MRRPSDCTGAQCLESGRPQSKIRASASPATPCLHRPRHSRSQTLHRRLPRTQMMTTLLLSQLQLRLVQPPALLLEWCEALAQKPRRRRYGRQPTRPQSGPHRLRSLTRSCQSHCMTATHARCCCRALCQEPRSRERDVQRPLPQTRARRKGLQARHPSSLQREVAQTALLEAAQLQLARFAALALRMKTAAAALALPALLPRRLQ